MTLELKKEWEMTGIIPKSILISMHDNNNIERKEFLKEINLELSSHKNKNVAFICASGSRSKAAMDFLNKGFNNIHHIPDGIMGRQSNGWLFQGLSITNYLTEKNLSEFYWKLSFQRKIEKIWDYLNNPEILKNCIDGCQEFIEKEKNTFFWN